MGHVTLLRTPNPCQTAAPHHGAHPPFTATVRPSRFQRDPCQQQGNFNLFPGATSKTCFLLGPPQITIKITGRAQERVAEPLQVGAAGHKEGIRRVRTPVILQHIGKTDKAEGVKRTVRQTGHCDSSATQANCLAVTQPFTVERFENCMFTIFFS